MSSIPLPAAKTPAPPPTTSAPKSPGATGDKNKDIIVDFFKKVGGDFLTKLLGKAPGPAKLIATGIEIFKVGVPLVKKIFGGLFGKKDGEQEAPKQNPGAGLTAPSKGQPDYRSLLADPKYGPAVTQLMQLGGLSAIQRAADEGRLPRDVAGLEALYRSGAQAVLDQGLPSAARVYDRTSDERWAIDELKPYLTDAKVSVRDLSVLLDSNRSLDERFRAFERILEDVTRPQERAKDRPQEKEKELEKKLAETVEKKEAEKAGPEASKDASAAQVKDAQEEEKRRTPDVNAPVDKLTIAEAVARDPEAAARWWREKGSPDKDASPGREIPAGNDVSAGKDAPADRNGSEQRGSEPGQRAATSEAAQVRSTETQVPQNAPAPDRPAAAAAPVDRAPAPPMPPILDPAPVMGGFDRSR